ncbi:cyclic nucleotide-binding-like protein [Chytridium lagenaria]|nr:cyclic nucleotide-binding-like protein [Chytridium lagenaria]
MVLHHPIRRHHHALHHQKSKNPSRSTPLHRSLRFTTPHQYLLNGFSRPPSPSKPSRPASPDKRPTEPDVEVDTRRLMDVAEVFSAMRATNPPPPRKHATRETRIAHSQASKDLHHQFMREFEKCLSRPASPCRSKPLPGKTQSFVDDDAEALLLRKEKHARPQSAPALTARTCDKADLKRGPSHATSCSVTSRPQSAPVRQQLKPSRPASPIRPILFNAKEAMVVRTFFQRKVIEASVNGQDASHFRILQLESDDEKQDKPFSVDTFIKNYVELINDGKKRVRKRPLKKDIIHSHTAIPELHESLIRPSLQRSPYDRTRADIDTLFRCLRSFKAFEKFSDFILTELCRVAKYSCLEKERVVFKQGDTGTAWFIIFEGRVTVQISRSGKLTDMAAVKQLGRGEGFGDLALVADAPRSATIITDERTELIKVEKEDYNRIIKSIHEKQNLEMYSFLRRMPVFSSWTRGSLLSVSMNMQVRKYLYGEVIYREGDDLKYFYIVKSGKVSVRKTPTQNTGKNSIIISVLHPLDYFGEEGVLGSEGPSKAKCTMIAGDLHRAPKIELEEALASDPPTPPLKNLNLTLNKAVK